MLIALLVSALLTLSPTPLVRITTLPDDLVGNWRGEGELFGHATEFEMSWERVLGDRFWRLTYRIRGATEMDAVAHYRTGVAEGIEGVWVDSRGEILELTSTATDTTLETIWTSSSERGRTTYEVTGADSLTVRDYYHDGTDWQPFGHARYSRVP